MTNRTGSQRHVQAINASYAAFGMRLRTLVERPTGRRFLIGPSSDVRRPVSPKVHEDEPRFNGNHTGKEEDVFTATDPGDR